MAIQADAFSMNRKPFLGGQSGKIAISFVQVAQGRHFGGRVPRRVPEETAPQPDPPVDGMGIFTVTVAKQEGRLGQDSAATFGSRNPRKTMPAFGQSNPVILGHDVVDHHEFG